MSAVTKAHPQEALLPADPMVSMIERIATDPNADLAKLEKMMEMKERHEASQAKAAFASAFAQASAKFPTIPLNGKGHNNKPYATLKDITAKTRPVLSEHGLALTFAIETGEKAVVVTAKLMHKDGHSESTSISLPADNSGSKNAVQAVGSTQTYGQRYTAQAILGLSLGDDTEDDGRGSSAPNTVTAEQFVALRDKLEEVGMDPLKFHAAFGHRNPQAADLHEFPADRFDEAMTRLAKFAAAKKDQAK